MSKTSMRSTNTDLLSKKGHGANKAKTSAATMRIYSVIAWPRSRCPCDWGGCGRKSGCAWRLVRQLFDDGGKTVIAPPGLPTSPAFRASGETVRAVTSPAHRHRADRSGGLQRGAGQNPGALRKNE